MLTPDLRLFCTKTLPKVAKVVEIVFRGAEWIVLDVYMLLDIQFSFQFLLTLF